MRHGLGNARACRQDGRSRAARVRRGQNRGKPRLHPVQSDKGRGGGVSNPWFRMYGDVINDPKVMRLPEAMRWHWVSLLCVASRHKGKLPPAADVAFELRTTPQRVAALVLELVTAGLLDKLPDGTFAPHNWEGRQYKSDSSTERVREHRDRKKRDADVTGNVSSDVTVTDQNRAEQKQSRAEQTGARDQVDLVEESLRADLAEIFGPARAIDLSRVRSWIDAGYDPGMVRDVVRDLDRRKPGIASLAYFDAALAERHDKRAAKPSERAAAGASINWDATVAMYARNQSIWPRHAGPAPGLTGCRAPADVLQRHGIDVATGNKIRKAG
ncbi:hypothetical protein [Bradyrhizobium sp. USDA 4452]